MSTNNKYELIPTENGFFRIRAVRSFGDVKKGDIGGLIQSKDNLADYGLCWIYDNARCVGSGRVTDNAQIRDEASIYQDGRVYGDAVVSGKAHICGSSRVYDTAKIAGTLKVRYADIGGNSIICKQSDYLVFKNWWGLDCWLTYTKSNKMWRHGCFYGNTQQTIYHFYQKSKNQGDEMVRLVEYVEGCIPFELSEEEKKDALFHHA